MSKAILVIDMPESCSKCPAYESGGYNERLEPFDGACFLEKHCMNGHKVTKGRPNWCPLVPIPEKVTEPIDSEDVGKDYSEGTMDGWNAAIDAIGGNDSE